jgi:hypothetical protein
MRNSADLANHPIVATIIAGMVERKKENRPISDSANRLQFAEWLETRGYVIAAMKERRAAKLPIVVADEWAYLLEMSPGMHYQSHIPDLEFVPDMDSGNHYGFENGAHRYTVHPTYDREAKRVVWQLHDHHAGGNVASGTLNDVKGAAARRTTDTHLSNPQNVNMPPAGPIHPLPAEGY